MPTTTGFVQSFFLGPGPLACVWIGAAPDSAELVFTSTGSAIAVLAQAQVTGREVDVFHPDDSAEVSQVTFTALGTADPLQTEGLEVTQSIQDLAGSIPLIAGKGTVVRVFLSNTTAAAMTVRGQLSVRRGPSDPVTVVASAANAVLDPAHAGDIAAQRNQLGRSLDFVLPTAVTGDGPLTIMLSSVTNVATGGAVTVGGRQQPTVWFHRSPPLRLRLIGVRYTLNGVTHVPRDLDYDFVFSWLRRAYPAGQLVASQTLVTATAAAPFTSGDINAQIAAIRGIDVDSGEDNRTHYYGLVSDGGFFMRGSAGVPVNSPNPAAVGSGPTGQGAFSWDTDASYGDWYTGHEIGHTFGRKHPGFCGETQDDLDGYPFPGGALADRDDSFCGYDVGDAALSLPRAVLPGLDWTDVMTYCDFEWLSPYTYQGIRKRLLDEDALGSLPVAGAVPAFAPPAVPAAADDGPGDTVGAGAAPLGAVRDASLSEGGRPDPRPGPKPPIPAEPDRTDEPGRAGGVGSLSRPTVVSVIAVVNLTRLTGRISHVNPVPRTVPTEPAVDSPYTLRVLGEDGQALASTPVSVTPTSRESQDADETGMIDVAIALPAGAAAIELRVGDRMLDGFRAANPGTEQLRTVRSEVSGPEVVLDLGREARPGTSYIVQVSDDGRRWRTVGVGLRAPRVGIDRREARAGSLQVRVSVTDGFTTTVVAEQTVPA